MDRLTAIWEFWRTRTTRQRMIYYLIAAQFSACGLLVAGACRVWPTGGPFLGLYIFAVNSALIMYLHDR